MSPGEHWPSRAATPRLKAVAAGIVLLLGGACSRAESTAASRVDRATVTPGDFRIAPRDTLRFDARALDGAGNTVSASFAWGAVAGAISSSGLFTAGNLVGPASVWVRVGEVADTVTGTITMAPAAVDTVFAEGFESNSLAVWDDRGSPGNHAIVSTESRSGLRALRVSYSAGGDGGWLTKFFLPGYDSLYVSYWMKLQTPWNGGTKLISLTGSRTDNRWSAIGTAGRCPTGTDFFVAGVPMDQNSGGRFSRFYAYYPAMPRQGDGVTCYGSFGLGAGESASYTEPSEVPAGGWHHVEFWVRLNTPGQSNGVQKFWVDGVLTGSWLGQSIRTSSVLMLNGATISASRGGGAAQEMLVDDVLVARARPGGT